VLLLVGRYIKKKINLIYLDNISNDHRKTNLVDSPVCDSDGGAVTVSLSNDVLSSISVSSFVKGFDIIS